QRLWARDTTLWAPDPPPPELADRLGWLDLPETPEADLDAIARLASEVPFWMTDLVLLGMGGSSLAPEVMARTLGTERLPLTVVDTTHPLAVREMEWLRPANTVFLVASKSGTTLETLSLFRHFWSRARDVVDDAGSHFIAITDPGSPLAELGRERRFRAVIEAPPDVGGRFSALSPFGLVPAGLMGLDIGNLLERAREAAEACREEASRNPGFRLGAALGELAKAGRDKLTFVTSSHLSAFPDWAEQLVAESTGKDGTGIVPVAHEPALEPEAYGADRVFVGLIGSETARAEMAQWGEEDDSWDRLERLEERGHPVIRVEVEEPAELGALFFVWEVAVAMAGAVLDIHPFNQPDVQLAKRLARRAMGTGDGRGASPADEPAADRGDGQAGGPATDPSDPADGDEPDALDLDWETARYGHAPSQAIPRADPSEIRARIGSFLAAVEPGDYVGLHVYTAGGDEDELDRLQRLREALTRATGVPTTLGYGPRFLHSTGQLHKGGSNRGVFLQIVDDAAAHVHVPETDFTFHRLIRAQARGDLEALERRERRLLRVRVAPEGEGFERLVGLVEEMAEERP
ncbi:MAG: transaldolase, partial [Gemmatimonadota bacterium]|nr:transaldolase [Gemmatimonadota bacterium]